MPALNIETHAFVIGRRREPLFEPTSDSILGTVYTNPSYCIKKSLIRESRLADGSTCCIRINPFKESRQLRVIRERDHSKPFRRVQDG